MALTSLNASLEPKAILQEVGIPVNHQLPAFGDCPFCGSHDFYATHDPRGGGWYTCTNCRFSGDSPHLLAKFARESVAEVVERLKTSGYTQTLPPERYDQYLEELRQKEELDHAWKRWSSVKTFHDSENDPMLGLLDAYGLMPLSDRKTWGNRMAPFFGYASKREFIRVTGITGTLHGRDSRGFLFTPVFDVPGRVCGYVAFDIADGEKQGTILPLHGTEVDGLAFLSTLQVWEDTVYATNHMPFLLCAQVRANLFSQPLLPMVGFTDATKNAWCSIARSNVVFWAPKLDDSLFLAARKIDIERSFISVEPALDPHDDPYNFLNKKAPTLLLASLKKHQKPWLRVLKDFLLDRDPAKNASLLERLDLSPRHRKGLLEACTETERDRLASMVDREVIELSIVGKNNKRIIQKADGWWVEGQNKERSSMLITEAIPTIESYTDFKFRTVLSGIIKVGGKVIPFDVDKTGFTVEWLERTCRSKAKELIKVNNFCSDDDLFYYALQFNKPANIEGISCLGWDETAKSFVFPKLIVLPNGEFMTHRKPIEAPHPVEQLEEPHLIPVEHIEDWVNTKPDRLGFWNLFVRILGEFLAPVKQDKSYGIAITADHVEHATRMLDYMARIFYLADYTLNIDQGESAINAVVAREAENNMPLVVRSTHPSGYLRWIQQPGHRNAIVAVPRETLKAFELRGGWEIVDLGSIQDFDFRVSTSLLAALLSWFQIKTMAEVRESYMPMLAFRLVTSWLEQRKPGISTELGGLTEGLTKSKALWFQSPAKRFLATILQLVEAHEISLEEVPPTQLGDPHEMAKSHIAVSQDSCWVDLESIKKVFDRRQLYMLPIAELVRAFRDSELLLREVYGLSDLKGVYLKISCLNG